MRTSPFAENVSTLVVLATATSLPFDSSSPVNPSRMIMLAASSQVLLGYNPSVPP